MLVLVVVIFGLCWLPIHGLNMARDSNPEIMNFQSASEYYTFLGLFLAAHWLAMSNSFANPIIYGFTNESFRVSIYTISKHIDLQVSVLLVLQCTVHF